MALVVSTGVESLELPVPPRRPLYNDFAISLDHRLGL